jgi:hypothetical protein
MQDAVLKVQKLGVPPEGFEDCGLDVDEETCQIWKDWIEAVDAIQRPVTWEEAEILIECCPTEPMSEVEWTILHCIESVLRPDMIEQYSNLIEKCNSNMMKDMLLLRFQNYLAKYNLQVEGKLDTL